MKNTTVSFFILFLSTALSAQPAQLYKLIQKGNQYYAKAKYDSAVQMYLKVVNAGWVSPKLYYNLGNAYFRHGDLAKAIIFYERAYRLDPFDQKIQHNLAFANQYVHDKFSVVQEFFLTKWWKKLALSATADTWAYLSIFTFALALILGFIYLFAGKLVWKKIGFYFGILFFLVSLITLDLSLVNKQNIINSKEAVILEASSVRSSPSDNGTELYILHQGVMVKIIGQQDGWYEVKLPNGSIGWIQKNQVEKI